MAIDTELKRKSIAGIPGTWMPISTVPTATPGNPERQAKGWSYAGIAAGAEPPKTIGRPLVTLGIVDRVVDVRGTVGVKK